MRTHDCCSKAPQQVGSTQRLRPGDRELEGVILRGVAAGDAAPGAGARLCSAAARLIVMYVAHVPTAATLAAVEPT